MEANRQTGRSRQAHAGLTEYREITNEKLKAQLEQWLQSASQSGPTQCFVSTRMGEEAELSLIIEIYIH